MEHHLHPLSQADLVLETSRLLLRPLSLDDLDLTEELFMDPEVMKYVGDVSPRETVSEDLRESVRRGAGGRIGVWCLVDRKTGEKLGTSILLPLPIDKDDTDWTLLQEHCYPDAEIEIGYILKRSVWGRGYATEACRRLLRFGFEQTTLEEISGITAPENIPSQHVLEKCGLRSEGLRYCYAEQCPGFRITRAEWVALESVSDRTVS